ncbi:MAG: hypothetical protein E6J91_12245 [Deltaproteobacteria bacterium]|nr:MAG: hypothetical protein E6J91_12245 [Deltaproteobacteria bacterium]
MSPRPSRSAGACSRPCRARISSASTTRPGSVAPEPRDDRARRADPGRAPARAPAPRSRRARRRAAPPQARGAGPRARPAREPGGRGPVDLDLERVWGISVPTLRALPAVERGLAARATAPGPTGPALFEAANQFEALIAQLVEAVAREARVRALGDALARASRQLHTLEQRIAPELAAQIAATTRALDERDREDQSRLRHLRAGAGRR